MPCAFSFFVPWNHLLCSIVVLPYSSYGCFGGYGFGGCTSIRYGFGVFGDVM